MTRTRAIHRLARGCGIAPRYRDISGTLVTSSDESLLAVMRAIEPEIAEALTGSGAEEAERLAASRHAARPIGPCHVLWDGSGTLSLRCDRRSADPSITVTIDDDDDGEHALTAEAASDGRDDRRSIGLRDVPVGIHRARVELGDEPLETFILSAPSRTCSWKDLDAASSWGLFAPAYALRDEGTRGAGDLAALERLASWCAELGGSIVGTLPLLAPHPDGSPVPSPYSPSSRRYWNETFVDIEEARGRIGGAACDVLWRDDGWRRRLDALERTPFVDWNALANEKGRALAALAADLLASHGVERDRFESWRAAHPELRAYAEHRVARRWWRDESVEAHEAAQWLVDERLTRFDGAGRAGLLLDLPLGVHPDGFDRHRESSSFAPGVSIGTPPDGFFSGGQSWGIAPLHPRAIRDDGYRYFIECLEHQMRAASAIRVDHVMGLYRMFLIADGSDASDGVYVRYRGDEMLAILSILSHRHRCVVVGEDLGTVPDYVREAMGAHGVARTYVAQTSVVIEENGSGRLDQATAGAQATAGTHDMPTLAGFWTASDVDVALEAGAIDDEEASRRRDARSEVKRVLAAALDLAEDADPGAIHAGLLRRMAAGEAGCLVVNLEDLWLEPLPQNVPGISDGPPSFCRRSAWALERIAGDDGIVALLREVDAIRRRKRGSVDGGDGTA